MRFMPMQVAVVVALLWYWDCIIILLFDLTFWVKRGIVMLNDANQIQHSRVSTINIVVVPTGSAWFSELWFSDWSKRNLNPKNRKVPPSNKKVQKKYFDFRSTFDLFFPDRIIRQRPLDSNSKVISCSVPIMISASNPTPKSGIICRHT